MTSFKDLVLILSIRVANTTIKGAMKINKNLNNLATALRHLTNKKNMVLVYWSTFLYT